MMIAANEQALVFSGLIQIGDAAKFRRMREASPMPHLIVTSQGGDVEEAIRFAWSIIESGVEVIIRGHCMSSCANYLFLAGARKTVERNSIVVWHGAPTREMTTPIQVLNRGEWERIGELSDQFFRAIDVPSSIAWSRPALSLIDKDIEAAVREKRQFGWSYSSATLASRFNVRNIVSMWYPETRAEKVVPDGVPVFFSR